MTRKPSRLNLPAKISRPAARGLVPRERLFAKLDEGLDGRAVWIFAPSGAGKTSLLTSWIEARELNALWYQLDAGDNDPATFFHYLGHAAPSLTRLDDEQAAPALPHLTPEYMLGLPVFVRRFFEALSAHVATPAVLVFDNYQDVIPDAVLHALLTGAIDALPPHISFIFASRTPPGAPYARHLASPTFSLLDWDELKLDDEETRAIAHARGLADEELLDKIVPLVRGWPAGLSLLIRASARGMTSPDAALPQGAVFDYFSTEVFEALPRAQQLMLATAALAPHLSVKLAENVCGPEAPAFLAELHANRLFVDCRVGIGEEVVYELHPLFRDFLSQRGQNLLSDAQRHGAQQRLARALEADGYIENAVASWAGVREWDEITRMITVHAPVLMEQGRSQTLENWIATLPDQRIANVGWLSYWRGAARSVREPSLGRADFENAYDCFKGQGEPAGALLASAARLAAYTLERVDNNGAEVWVDRCETLYVAHAETLPAWIESAVIECLAVNPQIMPEHRLWMSTEARTRRLMQLSSDPRVVLRAANYRLIFHVMHGDFATARSHLELLRSFAETTSSPPFLRILSEMNSSVLAWQEARHAEAHQHIDRAFEIAQATGVRVLDAFLHLQRAYAALSEGDLDRVEAALASCAPLIRPTRAIEAAHFQALRAPALFLRGERSTAIATMREAVERMNALMERFGVATCGAQLGQMLMLEGLHEEARVQLDHGLAIACAMQSDILEFHCRMALAWSWLETRDEGRGLEHLRAGLTIGARRDYMNCHPLWLPQVMAVLLAAALEAGIEVNYVRRFITLRKVVPDSPAIMGWPWPIRIYTLGRFRVLLGEQPLAQGRKVQRRALDLLKAIVALGGEKVGRERLHEALWPDAEGDAAQDAFEVTLHRLRKLLKRDDAILLAHGQVSLNPEVVWVDALAFDRLVSDADRIDLADFPVTPGVKAERALDKGLRLYAGHFLEQENDEGWMLTFRERLRSRFKRLALRAASAYEGPRAIDHLQRCIELEPAAEALSHKLMSLLSAAGLKAEAINVYRRCESVLTSTLGVSPSPEMKAMHARLSCESHL